jgi:hypothetical protein
LTLIILFSEMLKKKFKLFLPNNFWMIFEWLIN